jgi:hypothetical protein
MFWGNTGEKEKFRISSGNLAVQWHFCNYLKLQECHCTAKFPDEIRNFFFSVALLYVLHKYTWSN